MDALIIVSSIAGGAFIGWWVGMFVGFAFDKSDFPFLPLMTAPVGMAIGGVGGSLLGTLVFT